jgi:hypothetical protein
LPNCDGADHDIPTTGRWGLQNRRKSVATKPSEVSERMTGSEGHVVRIVHELDFALTIAFDAKGLVQLDAVSDVSVLQEHLPIGLDMRMKAVAQSSGTVNCLGVGPQLRP